ncbi:hypothetical protein [uncultured Thermosynechococcus sp.]|uniref:hypothetical protein n=1 Tax=uncultured Thermosynechococcus sp. TaxID=436945 RepID=UPI0026224243|nr:hypothetical protein [uncultured Thermosynechococcus sp.]
MSVNLAKEYWIADWRRQTVEIFRREAELLKLALAPASTTIRHHPLGTQRAPLETALF